jgi:hypothetical protein
MDHELAARTRWKQVRIDSVVKHWLKTKNPKEAAVLRVPEGG